MYEYGLHRALVASLFALLIAGCSGEAPAPASDAPPPAAQGPAAPAVTDEAGLRAAAASALSEQRIYAPAGNNAIEHYLALRGLKPDDKALATAMLELLPYALIGSEQALARGDLAEGRRLLDLVERADPEFPALKRLRDSIVTAEAAAALRTQAEADALVAREAKALADAEAAARLAAAPPVIAPPAVTPPAAEVATSPPVSAPVTQAVPPTPAQPTPVVAAPVAAAPLAPAAAPAPARPSAGALPKLLSAPSPRYPIMAQRRKLEGDVTVEFTIQRNGSVSSPRVVSATTPGQFEDAALVAASRWRFEPGAAAVTTTRVVQFRLGAAQR